MRKNCLNFIFYSTHKKQLPYYSYKKKKIVRRNRTKSAVSPVREAVLAEIRSFAALKRLKRVLLKIVRVPPVQHLERRDVDVDVFFAAVARSAALVVAPSVRGVQRVVRPSDVSGAAARAGRLSDVRGDRRPRPARPADAWRAVAGLSAVRGRGRPGADDGHGVGRGRPAERGLLRVPRGGGRGRVGGASGGRSTGRRPQGPRVH